MLVRRSLRLGCRKKEQTMRQQGVEVISSDSDYQPAVSTWGVYERPRDMSAAFGGGRSLKPEDSIMSTEEQAEYDRQLNRKLKQFRRASGRVIDPKLASECEHLTAKGAPRRSSKLLRRLGSCAAVTDCTAADWQCSVGSGQDVTSLLGGPRPR
jgi:hypothetical protein